jgi:hypothetical protein
MSWRFKENSRVIRIMESGGSRILLTPSAKSLIFLIASIKEGIWFMKYRQMAHIAAAAAGMPVPAPVGSF